MQQIQVIDGNGVARTLPVMRVASLMGPNGEPRPLRGFCVAVLKRFTFSHDCCDTLAIVLASHREVAAAVGRTVEWVRSNMGAQAFNQREWHPDWIITEVHYEGDLASTV